MSVDNHSRLLVLVHADIAGSAGSVLRDDTRTHEAIQRAFARLTATIEKYAGRVLETRSDALIAEFLSASDAIVAALAGQHAIRVGDAVNEIESDLEMRVGVALGDVVVEDGTVTGSGVVLAQRVAQLAAPGGVCLHGAVRDAGSCELPVRYAPLEHQALEGFPEPMQSCAVTLLPNAVLPLLESVQKSPRAQGPARRRIFTPGVLTLLFVVFLAAFVTVRLWPLGVGVSSISLSKLF